uniref:Fatty acyl-CoA reductase 1 n=1 Tax=Schizaphis graminum TaxID=13262 RepID=A0A2S2PQ81_SCHGA
MRCMYADPKKTADIVPGDYVSNAVLACAWDIHNIWKDNTFNDIVKVDSLDKETFVPPIYNFVSSSTNPLTWGEFSMLNKKYGYEVPSVKAISPILLRLSKHKFEYQILCFIFHIISGFIIDSLAKLTGRKPLLMEGYRKMHKFADVIYYFSLKPWTFNDNNTRYLIQKVSKLDQTLFRFDLTKLSWDEYFKKHVLGIRKYILKDPLETIPEGKKKNQKLYIAYYTLLSILAATLLLIVYKIFSLFV